MSKKLWKLPKAKAERWVEALRSGEYEQGQGHLVNEYNEYCCLGVFAHLEGLPKENLLDEGVLTHFDDVNRDGVYIKDLPLCLSTDYNSKAGEYDLEEILVGMNDNTLSSTFLPSEILSLEIIQEYLEGIRTGTFEDIADFLEAHVEFV